MFIRTLGGYVILPVSIVLAFEGVVQRQWDLAHGVVPAAPVIVVVVFLQASLKKQQ